MHQPPSSPLRRLAGVALACGVLGLLPACSTDQFWQIGQAWQRDHCMKLPNHQDRARCLADMSRSREDYERQVDGLRPAKP
ncbi:hypothetical protein [Sphaerotilus sp.]|uniref:hypothetical protein n=1 Tax=Sphaerotilus sp. TaxID=2093942 RepID=UPI002ACE051B|nr:hypothetical protein [Sphaerotilus sp.]MDZ7858982.1 hypothetical protein [Sphaerotilus sp.]